MPFLARFHAHVLLDKRFYEANIIVAQFLRVVGAIPVSFGAKPEERAALRETIRAHVDDARHPLLFFPEGYGRRLGWLVSIATVAMKCVHAHARLVGRWDTNGRRGLLMFNKFLFSLGHRVVPVVLKVSTPLPFCNVQWPLPTQPFITVVSAQLTCCGHVWLRPRQTGMLGSSAIRELLWFFFYPWYCVWATVHCC